MPSEDFLETWDSSVGIQPEQVVASAAEHAAYAAAEGLDHSRTAELVSQPMAIVGRRRCLEWWGCWNLIEIQTVCRCGIDLGTRVRELRRWGGGGETILRLMFDLVGVAYPDLA